MKKYSSNCWDTLKTIKLQRKDEICLGVNVMKIEKINCMRARLKPLLFFNGQSAAKPRIEGRSTTIPIGSTQQAIGCGNGEGSKGSRYSLCLVETSRRRNS